VAPSVSRSGFHQPLDFAFQDAVKPVWDKYGPRFAER
jgi:hypothetical protein